MKAKNEVAVNLSYININNILPEDKPVKEDIQLRSIYFRKKSFECCWLYFDLMDIAGSVIKYLIENISEKCAVKKEHIHILSTHNHGGGDTGNFNIDSLTEQAVNSVLKAKQDAKVAYVSYGEMIVDEQLNYVRRFYSDELKGNTTFFWGPCKDNDFNCFPYLSNNINELKQGRASYSGTYKIPGLTRNVKLPAGDQRLQILFFEEGNGKPIGSICRFAAHAVCCNSPEYYSSDYPYYVRKTLEEELGGISLFMNGPCGEIAPGILNKHSGGEKKLGQILGKKAAGLIDRAKKEKVYFIADYSKDIKLPLREEMLRGDFDKELQDINNKLKDENIASLPELKKNVERKRFIGTLGFLRSKATGGDKQIITLGKLVINDITIMAFPGEIFSLTAEKAIKRSKGEKIVTVTEHGGTAMYIIPEAEYDSGGYENTCCMVNRKAERILMREIEKFITP
jgi:hypothetical protein